MRISPKQIKICQCCHQEDLSLDSVGDFQFKFNKETKNTKKISIFNPKKNKKSLNSLF